jgi:hypothetical protein
MTISQFWGMFEGACELTVRNGHSWNTNPRALAGWQVVASSAPWQIFS